MAKMTEEQKQKRKEERYQEKCLDKAIEILSHIHLNMIQRLWLKEHKPYIYYLKYPKVNDIPVKTYKEETYSICSQEVKNFVDYYGDYFSCTKVRDLSRYEVACLKLKGEM